VHAVLVDVTSGTTEAERLGLPEEGKIDLF